MTSGRNDLTSRLRADLSRANGAMSGKDMLSPASINFFLDPFLDSGSSWNGVVPKKSYFKAIICDCF